MENKILEELNRVKLLSFYDTNLTLSENHNLIGDINIISEQGGRAIQTALKSDRALAKSMAKELDVIMSEFRGGVMSSEGNLLKNGDEIVNALKKGTLKQAELGKVNTNLFRKTTNSAIKTAVAKDMIESKGFLKAMSESKNEKEAIKRLMTGEKKFTQEEAEFLVKEYKNTGRGFGQSALGAGKTTATGSKKVKTRKAPNKQSTFKNWIKKFGNGWKSMSRTKKILAIASAGSGVYLLWRYFKDEEPGVFNDCVLSYMSDEDLTKMAQIGFGEGIIISETPNRQINSLGGVKLFTNGKLESVSGGIKGTWSSDGGSINVDIGGQSFSIPCTNEKIEDTDDEGSGTSRYKDCGSGPFSKGCYEKDPNGLIHKVQSCLGVNSDGKFWNVTETALMNKTGKNSFTKDDVNTICSQSSQSSTTPTTTQTPQQEFGTSDDINLVGGTGGQSGAQETEVNINDL